MNNVLVTAGVACLILATVGGGGKVLGVELRVIPKPWKLVVLALLGCGFLLGAYFIRDQPQVAQPARPQEESQEVREYRTAAAVACANIGSKSSALLAASNDDGTFDRDRLQAAISAQLVGTQATIDQLWRRPVPKELAKDAQSARKVGDRYLEDYRAEIAAMPTELPKTTTFEELQQWASELSAKLRSSEVEFQTEMSRLAGSPCASPTEPTR